MKKILFLLLICIMPSHAITLEEAKEAYNLARITNSGIGEVIYAKLMFEEAGLTNTAQLYELIRLTHMAVIDKKLDPDGRSTVTLFLDVMLAFSTELNSDQRNSLIYDIYGFTHKAYIEKIMRNWFLIQDALTDVQEHAMKEYEEAKRLLNL